MAEQKRVFIAIDISDETRRQIAAYIQDLRLGTVPSQIKWERPEKLHLTLKFLGDIDREPLRQVDAAVRIIAGRSAPFQLEVAGTGVFPDATNPRIIWIGIKGAQLPRLVNYLDDACEPLGFDREKRTYHPHLTIARIRDGRNARDLVATHLKSQFTPLRFPVRKLAVYESQLLRSGSIHTLVSSHDLGRTVPG